MVTGLLMAALGAGLFFPAAETRFYPLSWERYSLWRLDLRFWK
ncbi:hypothetical protein [Spirosoma telluris]